MFAFGESFTCTNFWRQLIPFHPRFPELRILPVPVSQPEMAIAPGRNGTLRYTPATGQGARVVPLLKFDFIGSSSLNLKAFFFLFWWVRFSEKKSEKLEKLHFFFARVGWLAAKSSKVFLPERYRKATKVSFEYWFFFSSSAWSSISKASFINWFPKKVASTDSVFPAFSRKGHKTFQFRVPHTYSGKLKNLLVGKHRVALCAPRHMSSFTTGLAAARLFRWCWSCVSIFLCNRVCKRKKVTSYKGISGVNVQGFRGFYEIFFENKNAKSFYSIQFIFIFKNF